MTNRRFKVLLVDDNDDAQAGTFVAHDDSDDSDEGATDGGPLSEAPRICT